MATTPLVGIIMGSQSDWETMKNAADMLKTTEKVPICTIFQKPGSYDCRKY